MLAGHTNKVVAVCAVQAGDRALLATANYDATVRLWDPVDGSQIHVLDGYQSPMSPISAICEVRVGDRALLATGGYDGYGTVRLWDPADGSHIYALERHADCASAVCAVPTGDRTLLAVGSDDGTVGVWNLGVALSSGDKQGSADSVDVVYAVRAVQLRNRGSPREPWRL